MGHLHEKHGGSKYVAMNILGKFFPPWTVPQDFWLVALCPDVSGVAVDARLFHDSRCRLVHKNRVYRDPVTHPALWGRVMNKLLALVARAMAIAHLTQLHIIIPASGLVAQAVPDECFMPVPLPRALVSSCELSFTSEVTVLGTVPESLADREPTSLCPPALPDPVQVDLPDIQIHEPVHTLYPEEDPTDVSTVVSKPDFPLLPASTSFDHFIWPGASPGPGETPSTFDLSTALPGWFPLELPRATGDPPSLLVSLIPSDSGGVSGRGLARFRPP